MVGAYVVAERLEGVEGFPITLPFVPHLDLTFEERVTVFVGENGTGKSTLLEALAELVGLPWSGGSGNEMATSDARGHPLARLLRPKLRSRPQEKYFFRAEAMSDLGHLLEDRENDPDFLGDPYAMYGGRTLKSRSHGEAALAVLLSRDRGGLFLLDEPELALSPARQLLLVRLLEERAATGHFQFLIATHSPILLSIRGAELRDFNHPALPVIQREDTQQWQVYSDLFRRS